MTEFLNRSLKHIIEEQPIALKETWNWVKKKLERVITVFKDIDKIYLAGCGDSYFVAIYGSLLFEKFTRIRTEPYESYEFLRYKYNFEENAALIAISASGRTSKTVDAAKKAKENNLKVIALTNYEDSPLARLADLKLITQVKNPYGPPSATSTTAMYILNIISRNIGDTKLNKKELEKLPDISNEYLKKFLVDVRNILEYILNKDRVYLVGAGPSYVSVLFGGAKFREAAWMHSIVFEAEELSHYGMISIDENDVIILDIPKGASEEKLMEVSKALSKMGAKQIVVTNSNNISWVNEVIEIPDLDEYNSSIISTMFYQVLAVSNAIAKKLPVTGFRYTNILTDLIKYYK